MPDSNCRNCGAPVKGNRCEYCGTEYPDTKEIHSYINMTASGIRVGVVVADRLEKIRRMERCAAYE